MATAVSKNESANGNLAGARRKILDVTARLLSTQGYAATTMRQIAAEVGIKPGSVYHYFPSKDQIVEEVVNEGVAFVHDALERALAELPEGSSSRTRLLTATKAHLFALVEHTDYTSASVRTFSYIPLDMRARNQTLRRKYEMLWNGLIEGLVRDRALPEVGVSAILRFTLGALNATSDWYCRDTMDLDLIAEDFVILLLRD